MNVARRQAVTLALARPPRPAGPDWWQALQERAWNRYQAVGLPGPRLDDWKYADTHPLTQVDLRLPSGDVAPMDAAQVAMEGVEGPLVVLVDGVFHPGLSRLDELPDGMTVSPLETALGSGGGGVERVGALAELDRDDAGLRALNLALASTGVVVELAPGCRPSAPLSLVHLVTEAGLAPQWRHVLRLGEGAVLTLLERYQGLGTHWHNTVVEAEVEAGAELNHIRLAEGDESAFLTHESWVTVAAGGRYLGAGAAHGHRLARLFGSVSLDAPEARAAWYGVYGGTGRHQADHTTHTHHRAPRTESVQLFKGVLGEGARGAYTGRVVVHTGAQKIRAEQKNANLLLSRNAEADARPQLEIYADDVQCAHGATVGELDADALFYLRARGIAEADARALLTRAFIEDVLVAFPLEAAARWVRERLGQGGGT